jgi:hypothetical protein
MCMRVRVRACMHDSIIVRVRVHVSVCVRPFVCAVSTEAQQKPMNWSSSDGEVEYDLSEAHAGHEACNLVMHACGNK